MLHIICIRAGEAFGPEYVTNLHDMVRRNLEAGFPGRFVCFTDRPQDIEGEGIEVRPLPADLPGWWSKLALFRKGLFPDGDRVLFFDLDTLITGPIDALAAYDGPFAILADFYRPMGLQSSVMAWEAGQHCDIWESYHAAGCPIDDPGGDQAWIERRQVPEHVRLQQRFPEMFVSYKKSGGKLPERASVVVFHGRPRPHEVATGWVPMVWKQGGISHAELKAVCNTETERLLSNMRSACARDLPWFDPVDEPHDRHVAIIGGGPSVVDCLREIARRSHAWQDIWVLNNAWRVLGHDVMIDAQVVLDARPETATFITRRASERLVASQCSPLVFDELAGRNVTLWHANSPGVADLLKDEKERVVALVGGGTTVGMNAIALAFSRGYRQIHLYGFDSSYRDNEHHAYAQPLNDTEPKNEVLYNGKTYICAPWMVGQAQEFMDLVPSYLADGCVITVHGEGLLPDIAKGMADLTTPAQVRAGEILRRVKRGGIGVEVGVFAADLSRELLRLDPELRLFMVDSWEGHGAAYQGDSGDWHAELTQDAQHHYETLARKRVAFAKDRAVVVRQRSGEAACQFADRYCDFVFLDADHSYEGCRADIEAWAHKIKPGGMLCGHDYANPDFPGFGVTQAVDEFAAQNGLDVEIGQNFCWFITLKDTHHGA